LSVGQIFQPIAPLFLLTGRVAEVHANANLAPRLCGDIDTPGHTNGGEQQGGLRRSVVLLQAGVSEAQSKDKADVSATVRSFHRQDTLKHMLDSHQDLFHKRNVDENRSLLITIKPM
jgi:hypothetical protein